MGKRALLIGVRDYEDAKLHSLPAVVADLDCLGQVLEEPNIGGFEIEIERDPKADAMHLAIDEFLDARTPDDVVVLYLSGHGVWSRDMGELFFAASDTHLDRLPETAVSAGYLNNALEECRAQHKVVLLDCCYSGAFAQGFRTRGAGGDDALRPALASAVESRGVYVITACDQRQSAYELSGYGEVQPSLFTGAVVKGLQTGHADMTGSGAITPENLYSYVAEQLRAHSEFDQSPTKSTLGVVGSEMVLAQSVTGRPLQLRPLAPADGDASSARTGVQPAHEAHSTPVATHLDPDGWRRLLDYYRDCLSLQAANAQLLPLSSGGRQSFALWSGADQILVGERTRVSVPAGTPAEALVQRAHGAGKTLAYGYPAVVLFDRQTDSRGNVAPLFTRVVEPLQDGDGWHLQPVGAVTLHPALLRRRLGKDDADAALAEFEPGWSAGSHSQLAREARRRLEELGLAAEALRPAELDCELDAQHRRSGGRNAALLYEAPESSDMTRGLLEELGELRENTAGFARTALRVFAPGSTGIAGDRPEEPKSHRSATGAGGDPLVVAPFDLNETQEAVLRSAMTRTLTVATGPPGTGKSQLVANLVATAVASKQSVLVTSTNNRAVDEVCDRCESLAPGLLLRTGSRDYLQAELDCLRRLRTHHPPDARPDWDQLRLRAQDHDETRERCAQKVRTEAELLELGQRRRDAAAAVKLNLADLPDALAQDSDVESLRRRAQAASGPRPFGGRTRRRLATLLGLPDAERATCSAAAEFLGIETQWRRLRAQAGHLHSDDTLADELRNSRTKLRDASRALVNAVVGAKVRRAQDGIAQRLHALQGGGSTWGAFNKMRPHLSAWAVTTHSAKRLPLDEAGFDLVILDEATQCSIPAVLPMLYRAKRALVIGDPMQLTHIATTTAAQNGAARRAAGLQTAFLERLQLDFTRHSAFHAAAAAFGEPLMLDEHFRCHPEIIALPNRLFYGERLTILTDPRRAPRVGNLTRVAWVNAPGSPIRRGGSSWCNEAEIEKVREVVAQLREGLPDGATIGVVTPYAAQKDGIAAALAGTEVRVGTVHTFQGGECDAMVLSLVGGDEMNRHTVARLERRSNLWNVAITRARAHLVVVGDRDFWRGRPGIVGDLERQATGDVDALAPDHGHDAAGDALHRILEQRFPAAFDRRATLDGYPCDFRIDRSANGDGPADSVAVIIDRGAVERDPARHLRLQLERCDRLRAAGMSAVCRIPAWEVHSEPDRVIRTLIAAATGAHDDGDRTADRSEPRPADRGVEAV